jgi:hypothetical protein
MGTYRGRFHKDRAVAGNNSLQAGNTPQRAGHAAAVIQFSNAFVLEVAKAPFKRFSDTLIHLSEDPDAPCVGVFSIFVPRASVIDTRSLRARGLYASGVHQAATRNRSR